MEIGDRGISKAEAKEIELNLIHELRPIFNRNFNSSSLKFTKENKKKAEQLRQQGFSYSIIANILGFSTMTVYRALNGGTLGLT